jgi:hypothetical protein
MKFSLYLLHKLLPTLWSRHLIKREVEESHRPTDSARKLAYWRLWEVRRINICDTEIFHHDHVRHNLSALGHVADVKPGAPI